MLFRSNGKAIERAVSPSNFCFDNLNNDIPNNSLQEKEDDVFNYEEKVNVFYGYIEYILKAKKRIEGHINCFVMLNLKKEFNTVKKASKLNEFIKIENICIERYNQFLNNYAHEYNELINNYTDEYINTIKNYCNEHDYLLNEKKKSILSLKNLIEDNCDAQNKVIKDFCTQYNEVLYEEEVERENLYNRINKYLLEIQRINSILNPLLELSFSLKLNLFIGKAYSNQYNCFLISLCNEESKERNKIYKLFYKIESESEPVKIKKDFDIKKDLKDKVNFLKNHMNNKHESLKEESVKLSWKRSLFLYMKKQLALEVNYLPTYKYKKIFFSGGVRLNSSDIFICLMIGFSLKNHLSINTLSFVNFKGTFTSSILFSYRFKKSMVMVGFDTNRNINFGFKYSLRKNVQIGISV